VHQLAGTVLRGALADWSLATGLGVPNVAPGLIFSPEDAVAPDVVWISNARLAQGLGDDGKLHIAPELVVEILSPGTVNERRDREVKLKLYSVWGAEEYWIIDWRLRTVEVYHMLVYVVTLTGDEALTSPLLPGFACPITHLWRLARG
jgi:Uma2 family endonuclease